MGTKKKKRTKSLTVDDNKPVAKETPKKVKPSKSKSDGDAPKQVVGGAKWSPRW